MRIIPRYLLREFLRPLFVCLLSFDLMYLVFDLFDNVSKFIETGFPVYAILKYYLCMIGTLSHWFTPASLMLATLYSMWMLSRSSEITAMRASGISFGSLARPFIVVAFLVAVIEGLSSEFVIPDASAWAARMKTNGFEVTKTSIQKDVRNNFPYYFQAGKRQWLFEVIDLADIESAGKFKKKVSLVQEGKGQTGKDIVAWKITGSGAEYINGEWWIKNPEVIRYDQNDGTELPSAESGLPKIVRIGSATETPEDFVLAARDWDNFSAHDMWRYLKRNNEKDPGKWYDFAYRFAAPWACVVITLFAIPAGLTTARQSILRGVFTALGAFFAFYAMTHFCTFLGKQGTLPVYLAAWLPNLVFAALGVGLYRKLT